MHAINTKNRILSALFTGNPNNDDIHDNNIETFLKSFEKEVSTMSSIAKEKFKTTMKNTEGEVLNRFQRLVIAIKQSKTINVKDSKLREIGLWMGIPSTAINKILQLMHQRPKRTIRATHFLDFLKTQ